MTPGVRRRALLVGTEHYQHLPDLPSCGADLDEVRSVLEHPNIGGYEVASVYDADLDTTRRTVSSFLRSAESDELVLLYVTGHGLRDTSGEFVFAAPGTDPARPAQAGLNASFLQDEIEACAAEQRIALLDCCLSGGFAVGFRAVHRGTTKGPGIDTQRDSTPLSARGVYILSSSAIDEVSYAGEAIDDEPTPSVFTAAICNVLREGAAGGDHGGTVSVEDLQRAVTDWLRGQPQTPTYSALQASGNMIIADRPHGPVPRGPASRAHRRSGVAMGPRADITPLAWDNLLAFFADVVDDEQQRGTLASHRSNDYLVLSDAVRLLLDDTDQIEISDEVALWARSHPETSRRSLQVGWPTATVGRNGVRVGPVLARTVELTDRSDGSTALTSIGPVLPGAALVHAVLEQEEAEQVLSAWSAAWRPGERTVMTRHAVHLIDELGLQQPQALNPDALVENVPVGGAADGVHNIAVLFSSSGNDPNVHLRADLAEIQRKRSRIRETALSCFLGPPPAAGSSAPVPLVLPKTANTAQRRVLQSTMTMPLTVATGPPGTGKSQLVVDAVATALAAGESVLVASTNKRAVDEVVERLRDQQPGSIIRTGRNAQEEERDDLRMFREVRTPFSARDARARLAEATRVDANIRSEMRRIVEAEHELHVVMTEYRAALSRLCAPAHWAEPPDVAASQARRLAGARVLGRWRRTRFLGRFGLAEGGDDVARCSALGDVLELSRRRRALMREREGLPEDEELSALVGKSADRLAAGSHDVLAATIAENARGVGTLVDEFLAVQGGKDWSARSGLMGAAPAWAVNVQSARTAFWVRPGMFDLVILDEAGQMPVSHAVPMLFRARRALIVGDPMQLPPVVTVPSRRIALVQERQAIDPAAMEELRLDPRHHSAFHAAARAAGDSHLLTEHFRCHPDIAEFVNRRFYGGNLTVLTAVDDIEKPAMEWTEARGPAQRDGRSWRNDAELERIRDLVAEIRSSGAHLSIGVISPFASQARSLESMVDERGEPRELLQAGSVHRFQGGERDVIVLSLVRPSPWLDREMRLWNVAITRARRRLIVVGDPDQWRGRTGVGADLVRSAGSSDHVARDDGTDLSLLRLLEAEDSGVRLGVPRRGRTADAILTSGQAVVVDHGPEGGDLVAHLHVMLHLRELLASDANVPARRIPLCDLPTGPP